MEWLSRTWPRVIITCVLFIAVPYALGAAMQQDWYPKSADWPVCETRADVVERVPCHLTEGGKKWLAVKHKGRIILYTPREGT